MSDNGRVVEVFQRLIDEWSHAIELMKAGKFGTHELREGRMVDTTDETISERMAGIAELQGLIQKIESNDS